ncbi:beta strand repeat-containing protein, partial [Paucihalobacter sp.]|uniref:beta strand repeat-containing protein n=2 Tax=Paucihalobacter sp. TaxID=2850405 RepID=UPI002FE268E9
MKRILLILLFTSTGTIAMAQSTWTGLGVNTNWNNTDNWDTNLAPTASDDVIIPSGFTVTLNVSGNVRSFEVQGNSLFEINASLTFTEPSSFGANTTVNWSTGTLNGTTSTLANFGTINLTGSGGKFILGDTTIDNSGTVNITSSGSLFISQGVFNNLASGVLDLQANGGDITWSGGTARFLNNFGLIKRTTTTGEAQIVVLLNNNGGVIQVESGTLSFQNAIGKNFNDGTYNVFNGAVMDWDTTMTLSGTITGTIDGTLNWTSNVEVPTTATIDFDGVGDVNWVSGALQGGGTLTHNSILNLTGSGGKFIFGDTNLDNAGTFNITSGGDLFITQGIFNNLASGVIDFQADGGNITWSGGTVHILNNFGLIKRTTSIGEAQILVLLNNNDGVIQVESGTLSFQNAIGKNFNDGTYNVFNGAVMDWDTTMTLSGTITGTIDGTLNWTSNVEVPTTATIDFDGVGDVNWVSGALQGGGTLTHNSILNLTGSGGKFIFGDTNLDNAGTFNITSGGDLFITQGIFNNLASGVIDFQADGGNITWSGGTVHVLNNFGLIRRSTTNGLVQTLTELNNFGTIEVATGELEHAGSLMFTNSETGVIKGVGIFDLPAVANYTNNGTFAPGLSPGTLSVQGDFKSTATSVLDIELNGLTPDTEHDVLAITGNNNIFEGSIKVTMAFEGTIGDTFTIATTTGTITTANLQSPIENVDFDGKRYTFEVSYPDNNKVVLTIIDKLDILPPDVITQNITVQLDPTGNVSILATDVDNGSTDNCTPTNELQFSVDVADFTCDDLGENIVALTVTDNDGNFATAQAIVTVEDSIAPTVVTQNITLQLDATGNASITANQIDNGSSDN